MKENSAYTIFNQENMETVKTRKAGKKQKGIILCLYHNLRESIIYKLQENKKSEYSLLQFILHETKCISPIFKFDFKTSTFAILFNAKTKLF